MIEDITDEEFENFKKFTGSPREYVEEWSRLGWANPVIVEDATDEIFNRPVKKIRFVSHGWSGNEHLQGIVSRTMFRMMFWHSSFRGGLDVYYVPVDRWDSPEWSMTWNPLYGED